MIKKIPIFRQKNPRHRSWGVEKIDKITHETGRIARVTGKYCITSPEFCLFYNPNDCSTLLLTLPFDRQRRRSAAHGQLLCSSISNCLVNKKGILSTARVSASSAITESPNNNTRPSR